MDELIDSGVYRLKVKNTAHSYIGASTCLKERMKSSRSALSRRLRVPLEDIECEVLERIAVDPRKRGVNRHSQLAPVRPAEQRWIHKLKPTINTVHNTPKR